MVLVEAEAALGPDSAAQGLALADQLQEHRSNRSTPGGRFQQHAALQLPHHARLNNALHHPRLARFHNRGWDVEISFVPQAQTVKHRLGSPSADGH